MSTRHSLFYVDLFNYAFSAPLAKHLVVVACEETNAFRTLKWLLYYAAVLRVIGVLCRPVSSTVGSVNRLFRRINRRELIAR